MLELSFYRDKKEEKGVVVGGEEGPKNFGFRSEVMTSNTVKVCCYILGRGKNFIPLRNFALYVMKLC